MGREGWLSERLDNGRMPSLIRSPRTGKLTLTVKEEKSAERAQQVNGLPVGTEKAQGRKGNSHRTRKLTWRQEQTVS